MTDVLRLSAPTAKDAAEADRIAKAYQAADTARRQKALEDITALQKRLDQLKAEQKQAQARQPAPASGKSRHVAHAEGWRAVTTQPDLCKVGGSIVAFDSCATLDNKQTASPNVIARGTPVYRQGDIFKAVQGDAGAQLVAGTSQGSGCVKIIEGHNNVKVNSIPIARHDSKVMVNCNAAGVGGALGKLVTEQKSVTSAPGGATNPDAPPGERTSERLERLKAAKAKIEAGQLDFNALDEYVNFKGTNKALDEWIGQIKGTPGTAGDYAAQAARGLLGFGKDIVTGIGELAYEGIKGVPKLARMAYTSDGQAVQQLNGAILAENIKLGNITPGTVGQGALDVGKALVKPITDPWGKGQYVESVTRGAAEVATLIVAPIKAANAGKAAKAGEAGAAAKATDDVAAAVKAADDATAAAKAKAAEEAAIAAKAKAAEDAAKVADDGVHVKKAPPPPLKTKPLDKYYEGEEIPGNKDNWVKGESTVKYLSDAEKEKMKLSVKDGKLYDAEGNPFDTSRAKTWDGDNKAIIVMDDQGNLYASNYQQRGEFHHSSLGQGKPVAMAGDIEVIDGNLQSISNRSGHYQPTSEMLEQGIEHLKAQGIDFTRVNIEGF